MRSLMTCEWTWLREVARINAKEISIHACRDSNLDGMFDNSEHETGSNERQAITLS